MKFIETEAVIKKSMIKFYKDYQKIFLIAFIIINVAFMFHTINFMFGDHDWNYIKISSKWNEGAFEGRPLHFILQSIFFRGQVLPILNNLLSFLFLTFSGIFLAKYWQIPKTTFNYTLFTVFIATQPHTLAWLFYAKDVLINLALPLIAVVSLIIGEYATNTKKYKYHFLSIFLMYFAYASYAAIINFYGVCVLGKIMFLYINKEQSFLKTIKQNIFILIDLLIALVLFYITLYAFPSSSGYNTKIIPLEYVIPKIIETTYVMFKQFTIELPFMGYKYKLLLLVLSVYGLIAIIYEAGLKKLPIIILITLATLFASKLAYFIADERGEILAEMENFAYVPRLDFYGLVYVYAQGLASILKYTQRIPYKIGIVLGILSIISACVMDIYAQKVWKFGFDAEMKINERIISKIEQHNSFYPTERYQLLQIGSLSMRKNFYQEATNEYTSLDLLSTSYTPEFMSRIAYNFYYPYDIFVDNTGIQNLSEKGKIFLLNKAKPFPSDDCIYIDGKIIIIVLTKEGLQKAKQKIIK